MSDDVQAFVSMTRGGGRGGGRADRVGSDAPSRLRRTKHEGPERDALRALVVELCRTPYVRCIS